MYLFLVAVVLTVTAITGTVVTTFQKDNKVKENITKSEELQTVQKLSVVNDRKIKLSNLIQKTDLSLKQKEDLDNFQKAVNTAVIKNNINNPTCSDLVATGYISQTKCNTIKNRSNDYATVKKGALSLSDPKMIQIINAKDTFKNSTTSNGITQIQSYNKVFLQKQKNIVNKIAKRERKEANIIATTTDLKQIQEYAKNKMTSITNDNAIADNSEASIRKNIMNLNTIANLNDTKNTNTGSSGSNDTTFIPNTDDESVKLIKGDIPTKEEKIKTIGNNIFTHWF